MWSLLRKKRKTVTSMLTPQFIFREFEFYDGNKHLLNYEVIPSNRKCLYLAVDIDTANIPKLRESK